MAHASTRTRQGVPSRTVALPLVILLSSVLLSSQPNVAAETRNAARRVAYHGYQQAIEISNPEIRVVLCPEVGGRVLEYSHRQVNVLFLSDEDRQWKPGAPAPSSAGRFDIGPELIVPERPVLWSGPWTGEITGPYSARMTSGDDPATGVRLVRDFELSATSSQLTCRQTIVNVSDSVREWCHWSRTFAVGGGICLIPVTMPSRFPVGYVMYEDGGLINMRPEDPQIRLRDGLLEIHAAPRKPKLGFDSSAGLMAYLAPNDLLFVKRFAVDRDRVYNEAAGLTISVWYPERDVVELEPIGPRERLRPGESASFTEEWWLAPLPFPESPDKLNRAAVQNVIGQLK